MLLAARAAAIGLSEAAVAAAEAAAAVTVTGQLRDGRRRHSADLGRFVRPVHTTHCEQREESGQRDATTAATRVHQG